jgi:DNA polymerase I-like protein with 3'-5' exonuclease and polymerase domains
MSYLVHDCETSTRASFKRKANQFDPLNWVVANGFKHRGGEIQTAYYGRDRGAKCIPILPSTKLLIGFNYKFDLLWHWELQELQEFFVRGGKIWCCQYAEYLLEGQQQHAQMCSMDSIVEKYKGTLKIDEVKALWAAGVDTIDIPEDLLIRYLGGSQGDIANTELIFLGQVSRARRQGQLIDICERMEGLLCTTEMEYNGLHVNRVVAQEDQAALEKELQELEEELQNSLPEFPPEFTFNWRSPVHKSTLIFGGAVPYEKWMPHLDDAGKPLYCVKKEPYYLLNGKPRISVGAMEARLLDPQLAAKAKHALDNFLDRNASGKNAGCLKTVNVDVPDLTRPKGAKQKFTFTLPGYTDGNKLWLGSLTDAEGGPIYSTGKDILEALGNRNIGFLKSLANRTKVSKDLSTYYEVVDEKGVRKGMLTCLGDDNRIHHKLNHTNTITTRLSSSDPNLQNLTRPDFDEALGRKKSFVKRMFESRFGADGCMIESDYSQLEVVVQGLLSNDPQLVQDIINKVDFHCKRLAAKLNEDYSMVLKYCKDEAEAKHDEYKFARTEIKQFTFQRAYGAGAPGISASTGIPLAVVKELIEIEERLYPGITTYYNEIEAACEKSRWPTNTREPLPDKPGVYVQCGKGKYLTPTQALFVFTEVPAPEFVRRRTSRDTAFYRPHIQNYPIQGVGGQVVQYVLGRLFRHFIKSRNYGGKAFLVNTVHDCVWIDCHKSVLDTVARDVKRIMESIPAILTELYGMAVQVPFPVEVEVGPNMLDLHKWKEPDV